MNRLASIPPRLDDEPTHDQRRAYEAILARAMRFAERVVPRDQAFEIAHDVAVEMLRRPPRHLSGTVLYLRVTSRLRNLWRAGQRRALTDGAFLEMRAAAMPAWAEPGSDIEVNELRERIARTLDAMPVGMRHAFLLVREEELSYKEAAARLGVSVGTVHTQLSRANALLRDCVDRYHNGDAAGAGARGGRK